MGCSVLVPSAAPLALVDLATVKARLGIDLSDTSEDAVLSDLILEASRSMESYFGGLDRQFPRQTYYEQVAGMGKPYLLLSQYPVDRDSVTASIYTYSVQSFFRIHDERIGKLFIWGSWGETGSWSGGGGFNLPSNVTYGDDLTVDVQYTAGWLLPGQVSTWKPSTAYAAGAWVRPATVGISPLLFQCTAPGTSGATEPAWPVPVPVVTQNLWHQVASRFPVADGTAAWISADAHELPLELRGWCAAVVRDLFLRRNLPSGVTSVDTDGTRHGFAPISVESELPHGVMAGLDRLAEGRM
jgi:hypothetical protein